MTDQQTNLDTYQSLAKDAGNKLRAYILSVSSGATGVFFVSLTGTDASGFSWFEKGCLLTAIVGFFCTVGLCLYELRVDAQRFYEIAAELKKPEKERSWRKNEQFKKLRYRLIHGSYVSLGISVSATCVYLVQRVVQ